MKNKALTYLLIVVVAVIWYQVFLRIKSNVTANDDGSLALSQQNLKFVLIQKDTFLLDASYRDPFIGKSKLETSDIPVQEIIPPPPTPAKPQFTWPTINYYGWVRKTDSKNPLCIVNIDGMLLYLRKGEEIFDGIRVMAVERDFIQLKKGKNQHYFYRE